MERARESCPVFFPVSFSVSRKRGFRNRVAGAGVREDGRAVRLGLQSSLFLFNTFLSPLSSHRRPSLLFQVVQRHKGHLGSPLEPIVVSPGGAGRAFRDVQGKRVA